MSLARDREAERLARWHARDNATREQAWVVTYGLARRLMYARTQREARDRFAAQIARPGHLPVASNELTVRPATEWDLGEFESKRPDPVETIPLFTEEETA